MADRQRVIAVGLARGEAGRQKSVPPDRRHGGDDAFVTHPVLAQNLDHGLPLLEHIIISRTRDGLRAEPAGPHRPAGQADNEEQKKPSHGFTLPGGF
jgi:hypothetical protein